MFIINKAKIFPEQIRTEIEQLISTGKNQKALELSTTTGQSFDCHQYPRYFTGDLQAKVVLIRFHYEQANDRTARNQLSFNNFDEYFDYYQNFGTYNFGRNSPRKIHSLFDIKQVEFLQPLNLIDLVTENSEADRLLNLEIIRDRVLRLKLIPYATNNFSLRGFTPEILQFHVERILNIIIQYPREYILFYGSAFEQILRKYTTAKHKFELRKEEQQSREHNFRFSILNLSYRGQTIKAGLAQSVTSLSKSMSYYGKECQRIYHEVA